METLFAPVPLLAERAALDGWRDDDIDVSTLLEACGRTWTEYSSLLTTRVFTTAFAAETGLPASALARFPSDDPADRAGTWVHPQLAIRLAQWIATELAVRPQTCGCSPTCPASLDAMQGADRITCSAVP